VKKITVICDRCLEEVAPIDAKWVKYEGGAGEFHRDLCNSCYEFLVHWINTTPEEAVK
jgi:hypothetical protein